MPYNNPIPERKRSGLAAGGLRSLVQAERLLQIVLILPASMAICGFAGALADEKLHTHWMMIAGGIFGCIAGMFYTVRLAIDAERRAAAEDAKQEKRSGTNGLE